MYVTLLTKKKKKSLGFKSNVAFNECTSHKYEMQDRELKGSEVSTRVYLERAVCWRLEMMVIFITHFMMCWVGHQNH